ncbi:MAG: M20/M25/M40 family metallo-hydrolase [Parafilimonas sp.]|nr:M20/M25/M40 family metallo-hydrolase [Parafilimonas sp.]
MKNFFLVLFLLPVVADAQNMNEDSLFIHQIAVNILSSDASYNNLHYLTKNIGGRLSGSTNMYKAEQWGEQTLKNAGADNVIMQECMVPHWVRGGQDKAYITYKDANGKPQKYWLNVLALGNSVGSGAKGIEAPLIRVNNFDDLEAKKNELKGKIVFYNVPFDDTLINTFQAYSKNVIYRAIGASRAAKYGAVAMLMRSMTNTPGNYPHTGSLRYADSIKKIPAAAMGLEDVKKLDSLFDKNITVTASLFTYGTMLPDTIAHNVIGELKGSEHPEQIITVGGHLDSWDPAEGANDDGTGIVQTIEVLRVLKALGYQPKHTIQFVLFANEENGTRGAKEYAAMAKKNNEQHIFALESDAGGFTPRGFAFDCNDIVMQKINSWKSFFTPYYGDRFEKGEAGADVGYLMQEFHTPQAGLSPDSQRYFYIHHAATDVFENVDIREMKLGAINMAALIYLVDKYGLQ